jgi:hypothetical protein
MKRCAHCKRRMFGWRFLAAPGVEIHWRCHPEYLAGNWAGPGFTRLNDESASDED